MKFAKLFLIGLAALAAIGFALAQFVFKDQIAVAQIGTAYAAKQICSCRFVSTREMDSCMGDFTQDLGPLKISETYIDATGRADQSVTASALGIFRATATYEPGLGCTLQK